MASLMFLFLRYVISESVLGHSTPVSGMILEIFGLGKVAIVLVMMSVLQLLMYFAARYRSRSYIVLKKLFKAISPR